MAPPNVEVPGSTHSLHSTSADNGTSRPAVQRIASPRPRFGFDSSGQLQRRKPLKILLCRKECAAFLEEPTHSWSAFTCHVVVMFLVLISSVLVCLDTLESFQDNEAIEVIEGICSVCFTIELIFRIACWQEKYWRILFNFWIWIDVLAIVPFYGSLISDAVSKRRTISTAGLRVLSIMRLLRLLRLLKLVRHYEGSAVLGIALQRSLVALLVPLFFLGMLCFVFGGVVYYVEGVIGGNDAFGDIFRAAWFVLVTLSTVGYGDMAPQTVLGRLVTVPIIITGVLFMAMPISIVGTNFTVTWEERDVMLLASKIKKLNKRRGLTEADAVNVFKKFDHGGDGEVDIREFKKALDVMGIQLEHRQLASAFHAFDLDLSGTVSYSEFCDKVFPRRDKNLSAVGTIKSFIALVNKKLDIDSEDPLAWQHSTREDSTLNKQSDEPPKTPRGADKPTLSPERSKPTLMKMSKSGHFNGGTHSFGLLGPLRPTKEEEEERHNQFAKHLEERAAQQAEQFKSERERVAVMHGHALEAANDASKASAATVGARMDKCEERLAKLESSVNRVLAHLEAALPLPGARPAPAYAPAPATSPESASPPAPVSTSAATTTAAVAEPPTPAAADAAPAAADGVPVIDATPARRRRTKAASATAAAATCCRRLSPQRPPPASHVP